MPTAEEVFRAKYGSKGSAAPKSYSPEEILKARQKQAPPLEINTASGNAFDTEIRPHTWRDTFREWGSPIIRSLAIGGGATAGTVLSGGNPVGTLLGGMGGDQLYQRFGQDIDPSLYGSAPQNPIDSTQESLTNTALEFGGNAVVNKLGSYFSKNELLRNFFKSRLNSQQKEALQNAPKDLPLTIGQATQNKGAQMLEDLMAGPEKKARFIDPAEETFGREWLRIGREGSPTFSPDQFTRERAEKASVKANTQRQRLSNIVTTAYNNFRNRHLNRPDMQEIITVTKNNPTEEWIVDPVTGQGSMQIKDNPVSEAIKIKGPIYINETTRVANEINDRVTEILKNPTLVGTEEAAKQLTELQGKLRGFLNPHTSVTMKSPVMDWEAAKRNKKELFKLFKRLPGDLKTELSETMGKMSATLNQDMKTSMQMWPQESRRALERANKLFETKASRYDNKLVRQLMDRYNDPDLVQEEILEHALQNSTRSQKYIDAVGDKEEIGAQFISNAMKVSELPDGGYDYTKLRDYLIGKGEVAKTVLNSKQRQSLDYLARNMSLINPNQSTAGQYSLAFRRGVATLSVSAGLYEALTGEEPKMDAIKGGIIMLAFPMTRKFVEKTMLNTANARKLALMTRVNPKSQQGTLLSRSMLQTLKGLPFKVIQSEVQYDHEDLTNPPEE